jgi:hypothetical protein
MKSTLPQENPMQLVSTFKSTAFEMLPLLAEDLRAPRAANDSAGEYSTDPALRDLNTLLTEVVKRVTKSRPGITKLEFKFAPDLRDIVAAPDLLAFVVGGVLSHQIDGIEISELGHIRVTTGSDESTTTIRILANSPPALDAVRAVEDSMSIAKARGGDPIVLHCRRILEQFGGSLFLREEDELVGFELSLPKMPVFAPASQVRPPMLSSSEDSLHKYCMAS